MAGWSAKSDCRTCPSQVMMHIAIAVVGLHARLQVNKEQL